jgi:hypothetical protein
MAKAQIWLRPDQVDLLRTLLKADLNILSEQSLASKLEYALVRFSARRIDELLALLPPPQSAPRLAEDKTAAAG